jgi:hypothetical protein
MMNHDIPWSKYGNLVVFLLSGNCSQSLREILKYLFSFSMDIMILAMVDLTMDIRSKKRGKHKLWDSSYSKTLPICGVLYDHVTTMFCYAHKNVCWHLFWESQKVKTKKVR